MKSIKYSYILAISIIAFFLHFDLIAQNNSSKSFDEKLKPIIENPPSPESDFEIINGQNTPIPFVSERPFNPLPAPYINSNEHPSHDMKVFKSNETGLPIFVKGPNLSEQNLNLSDHAAIEQAAYDYLQSISSTLDLKKVREELAVTDIQVDEIGMAHIRLQQMYEGIEVHGKDVVVHLHPNGKRSFNGRYQPSFTIENLTPTITKADLIESVTADISTETGLVELSPAAKEMLQYEQPSNELMIYIASREYVLSPRLAFHVEIRPNVVERWEYVVDAHNGEILQKINTTCSFVGPTTATGTDLNGSSRTINVFENNGTYYLLDTTKDMYTGPTNSLPDMDEGFILTYDMQNQPVGQSSSIEPCTSSNNSWTANRISAQYNAEQAYDYFEETFNRNSIDGDGGDVYSFINVADNDGSGLDNAFWNGVGMFYGNGSQAFNPLAGGLDVGGHEMTHGVIEHTANLEYQYQSGALNESFADIFAAMIDRNDWDIGEDIVKSNVFPSGAMRSLSDPHNEGSEGDFYWQPRHWNERYTGSQDNGGVHINSGIPNYAFYKLATDVGKDKAEQIYYRALNNYLTRTSQFVDCRIAVLQAAEDLYGQSEVNAAIDAFNDVGIEGPNTGTGAGQGNQEDYTDNPGEDFILFTDLYTQDQGQTIYVTDQQESVYYPISFTQHDRKMSITDNGEAGVFINSTGNIVWVDLSDLSNPSEEEITSSPEWGNVAISKDGNRIAAVKNFAEPFIYIWDISTSSPQLQTFELYNPTTADPNYENQVNPAEVLYADALEFDHTGEYLLYDAYNEISTTFGSDLDYWDVGLMRVWKDSNNTFGDGNIIKLFTALPEGISIGNGSFSKNSPYIIAFDYLETNNGVYAILGANTETYETNTIFENNGISYPNYSVDDDKIIFNFYNDVNDDTDDAVYFINLQDDKISSTGSASQLISLSRNGVWFATGERILSSQEELIHFDGHFNFYPNPVNDQLMLDLETTEKIDLRISIYNMMGQEIKDFQATTYPAGNHKVALDMSQLLAGTYIIQATTDQFSISEKVMKITE